MRASPALLLLALVVCAASALAAPARVEHSVLHITTFSQRPDWESPWQVHKVRQSTGTGFVLEGNRILTNAHVVADAKVVQIRRFQEATPFTARVKFIGHDCDLAMLEVDDPRFYEGMAPLKLAKALPPLRTTVRTYGYPTGGLEQSSTEGVFSRYEYRTYVHNEFDSFPAAQTDAAINPGNSGGPVLFGDRVVGVAFQGRSDLQGTGYFIPVPIVEHFLGDVADGRYDAFADLGVQWSELENPSYRAYLKLPERTSGVVVDHVWPGSSADGALRRGDVLLGIDGVPIDFDGKLRVGEHKLHFGFAIDRRQVGESVPVDVWRDGRRHAVRVRLQRYAPNERSRRQFESTPRYFVFGGLLFMPLDVELLSTFGGGWMARAPRRYVYDHHFRRREEPATANREIVVLVRRLPDPANSTLAIHRHEIVEEVNGRRIEGLKDLVEAFEKHEGPRHLIRFEGEGQLESIGREAARAANARIMETYGLVSDRRL